MLALGQWFIDKKTAKIFEQNNENQELELCQESVKLLIILAENQDKLMHKEQLKTKLWPDLDQQQQPLKDQQLQQLVGNITHQLGNNIINITPDQYYLLQLPTFSYQYTPITQAQMKQKLAEKQLVEVRKQTNQNSKITKAEKSLTNNQTSVIHKLLVVTILALLIAAFLAAS